MTKRSSQSTDDGDESLFEPERPAAELKSPATGLKSRPSSSARNGRPGGLNWKQIGSRDGHTSSNPMTGAVLSSPVFTTSSSRATMAKTSLPPSSERTRRGPWSISLLCLVTTTMGIALLAIILRSLVTHQIEPKGCRMSYMRPAYVHFTDFDTEHTRFATKYSLYLYREQGLDEENELRGTPILFIPGNAGSYKQVRTVAAETANYFHNDLEHDGHSVESGVRNLDFFTVDFNEDITAFHGQTLLDQAEYLNEAIRYILSLYSDPQQTSRDSNLPDPTSVIILGHSMGGVVARAMLVQSNYQSNSINTIITMSAPHARPPITFDGQIVQIYDEINDYWRRAYSQKWANDNPLWHVTLVSIAGGSLDVVVPSDYASLESLVPETHGFTVFTTGIPTVWTSMDHQAILWCDQFRKVLSRTLYDIVDVHRASQTKPRADRMRVFKKRLLSGLEITAEKTLPQKDATTLLTLDEKSSHIIPSGERFALSSERVQSQPKAYLLPIPPQELPESTRFTLLTDGALDEAGQHGDLEVLLCSVFPSQTASVGSLFSSVLDFSGNGSTFTRLACKNVASDTILLPASTSSTGYPFYRDDEPEIYPFSYLQYDLEHLSDHQFVAVVDKSITTASKFVVAEFSDQSDYQKKEDISFSKLFMFGLSAKLPADRPISVEVKVPSLNSGLLSYNLEVTRAPCAEKQDLFAPFVRQYLERPYESRYFVNVRRVGVSLHGIAPYIPPPLESRADGGLVFQVWSDPTCRSDLYIDLKLDIQGSMGKLYMRYRTVFAAFPLLIVTLVLRKQFRVYDDTGVFISFSESLDLSLRQSIPLLLFSLTLLAVGGSSTPGRNFLLWNRGDATLTSAVNFHQKDLLIGTEDPFFCFLVPLIGLVCIGVCAILHYIMLGLTQAFGLFYALLNLTPAIATNGDRGSKPSPAFVPSTPRRRMISTAVLLFLVSTFIPYQFAYLVACLVQLFTVVRALRIYSVTSTGPNSNYYHYAHSILLLMMWVLPINLPILAVWIRNLAVHWLTPFSSHHNVLSIMPFILLVENLTTGKMVPKKTNGLRHITSTLLFATALCAAMCGVSHAYILHYLVNVVAAWLVVLHSTSDSWSLTGLGAMFEGNASDTRKEAKSPS